MILYSFDCCMFQATWENQFIPTTLLLPRTAFGLSVHICYFLIPHIFNFAYSKMCRAVPMHFLAREKPSNMYFFFLFLLRRHNLCCGEVVGRPLASWCLPAGAPWTVQPHAGLLPSAGLCDAWYSVMLHRAAAHKHETTIRLGSAAPSSAKKAGEKRLRCCKHEAHSFEHIGKCLLYEPHVQCKKLVWSAQGCMCKGVGV